MLLSAGVSAATIQHRQHWMCAQCRWLFMFFAWRFFFILSVNVSLNLVAHNLIAHFTCSISYKMQCKTIFCLIILWSLCCWNVDWKSENWESQLKLIIKVLCLDNWGILLLLLLPMFNENLWFSQNQNGENWLKLSILLIFSWISQLTTANLGFSDQFFKYCLLITK